jgi:hypothetical protein
VPTTVAGKGDIAITAEVARLGVGGAPIGVNRRVDIILPAPPAIRVESAAENLDIVGD